jgi:hypothetical protein
MEIHSGFQRAFLHLALRSDCLTVLHSEYQKVFLQMEWQTV